MSSLQWNCREYRGSRGVTLVTGNLWVSSGGEELGGVTQRGCDGSLYINQISRYCGLKMVVGHNISMVK